MRICMKVMKTPISIYQTGTCVLTRWWRFSLVIPDDHNFGETLDQGELGDDLE